jgi:hypothetical protein
MCVCLLSENAKSTDRTAGIPGCVPEVEPRLSLPPRFARDLLSPLVSRNPLALNLSVNARYNNIVTASARGYERDMEREHGCRKRDPRARNRPCHPLCLPDPARGAEEHHPPLPRARQRVRPTSALPRSCSCLMTPGRTDLDAPHHPRPCTYTSDARHAEWSALAATTTGLSVTG